VIGAQADGDWSVRQDRGRRALRLHIKKDIAAGLKQISEAVTQGLS